MPCLGPFEEVYYAYLSSQLIACMLQLCAYNSQWPHWICKMDWKNKFPFKATKGHTQLPSRTLFLGWKRLFDKMVYWIIHCYLHCSVTKSLTWQCQAKNMHVIKYFQASFLGRKICSCVLRNVLSLYQTQADNHNTCIERNFRYMYCQCWPIEIFKLNNLVQGILLRILDSIVDELPRPCGLDLKTIV